MDIVKQITKEVVQTIKKKLMDVAKKNIYKLGNELYQEAQSMYDSFITQYYNGYSPSSYIRHIDRQNSWSMGLYDGQNIELTGRRTDPILKIDFLATDMMNDYEYDSAYDVLHNVMEGWRGVSPFWIQPWYPSYSGKYFNYSGRSMTNAFEFFIDHVDDIVEDYFSDLFGQALKELM